MRRKVYIDGDSIAYRAGYADTIADMVSCINSIMGTILLDCETNCYELWLEHYEGKHIFRKDLAITRPYKGNRRGNAPPLFLKQAKQYMEQTFNARLLTKYESEDVVLIRAYEDMEQDKDLEPIIAYIDKDLLQYPLLFYNYNNRAMTRLSEDQADYNLWHQVITGDSTDNIVGMVGFGKAKATKSLAEHSGTHKEACIELYKRNGYDYLYFIEQYNLVRLRNKRYTGLLYPITEEKYKDIICS